MNIDELLTALNALRVTVAEAMERIDAMASALEAQKVTPQTLADVHVSIPPTEADSPVTFAGAPTLKMAIDLLHDYVRVLNDQSLVSRPAEDALRGEKHPAAPPNRLFGVPCMTVGGLRALLAEHPDDMFVVVRGYENGTGPVWQLERLLVALRPGRSWYEGQFMDADIESEVPSASVLWIT